MTGPRIVFRVDGNAHIGLGHLTRCQALAELLTDNGWACVLITREHLGKSWFWRGSQHGWSLGSSHEVPIETIPNNLPLLAEPDWLIDRLYPHDILVLDGYSFTANYQLRYKQQGRALVCFDDFAVGPVWADIVLNAAGGITPARYPTIEPGAQLCLGPGYALLRPAFWQARKQTLLPPNTDRVFLNMGGADPDNHTLRLLHELHQRFPHKHLSIVTGTAYPHQTKLSEATAGLPNVHLHHAITAAEMAELLQRCGIYVCPPSGMAYECCAIGGLLFLHQTADNQQLLRAYLLEAGLALPYEQLADLRPDNLPALAAAMRKTQQPVFAPEKITENFCRAFQDLEKMYQLQVRRAAFTDVTLYFSWANDPTVRANAIHSEPIAWPGHVAWFERRLADADTYLYLFAWEGQLIGQVRIEFTDNLGTIDYSVDATWRGKQLGRPMLRRALVELWRERAGTWKLRGEVSAGNHASARVFEALRFTSLPAVHHQGQLYEVFELAVNSDF
jgi:UDP-2,4-diacetamido-2,4,6-trideoxy-beta-L-altropyranose hydrolase